MFSRYVMYIQSSNIKGVVMRRSVDVIARYASGNTEVENELFVVIKRLSFPTGLAFTGGGIEPSEAVEKTATREFKEETGLHLSLLGWLPKIYNDEGRDPRGSASSRVAFGKATGTIIPEEGKTEVLLLSKEEITERHSEFVFDHFQIFLDFLALYD